MPRHQARTAFTMIELLVVLTIALLLVAMLVPMLSVVESAAKDVDCRNRLRQLGLASLAFANDRRGTLPGWDWCTPGYNQQWTFTLSTYLANEELRNGENAKFDAMAPYYTCPGAPPELIPPWRHTLGTGYYPVSYAIHQLMSYPINPNGTGCLGGPSRRAYGELRLSRLSQTGQFQMFIDNNVPYWIPLRLQVPDSWGGPNPATVGIGFRHRNRANLVYADGHVDNTTPRTYVHYTATTKQDLGL